MSALNNAFSELSTAAFYKAVLSEFLGTAILIIVGCGSVANMAEGRDLPTFTPALVFGFTVATIVWTFNHLSGAHINPAVTIAFWATGHIRIVRAVVFIVIQCAGAISGAAVIWEITPPAWRGNMGSTVFHPDVTLVQGFAIEFISTFILLVAVFSCADQLREDHGGSTPLTVGIIVLTQSAWAGKQTGCSMNPARTLGPALISGAWDHHWVYWVAPILGGLAGALLYHHVLAVSTLNADGTGTAHASTNMEVTVQAIDYKKDSTALYGATSLIKSPKVGTINRGFEDQEKERSLTKF